jgi:hypothetical protein
VVALKALQQNDGKWPFTEPGATALAGITLLECGVDPGDKAVAAAAQYLRQQMIRCDKTYSIALALLFLDLLGDPGDLPLIESLTVRLLAGQGGSGGWSYTCPPVPEGEIQRLEGVVRLRKAGDRPVPPRPGGKRTVKDLDPETRKQLDQLARNPAFAGAGAGDNSNTQFATLALWVARRSGMPVEAALVRIETRYRQTQNTDGGWGYTPPQTGIKLPPGAGPATLGGSTPSMTGAGLLGLLVAHGVLADIARERKKPPRDLGKDAQLTKGLAALSTAVGHPVGDKKDAQIPRAGGKSYYFLWSVERVCMVLELETLNKKDWYAWGTEVLLANQQPDGSWRGEYAACGADTCFALLFLQRSNLVRDLTDSLKGKQRDPAGKLPEAETPQPAQVDASPSARLAGELLKAPPAEQGALLQKLQETRGVENTEALAFAIPRLEGEIKQKAREALTTRLARLKADSLLKYLDDEEPEIRRAAALACAVKGLKTAIPKLIPRLRDREEIVARAAHTALKELSGQDLGTAPAEWEAWWMKQGRD